MTEEKRNQRRAQKEAELPYVAREPNQTAVEVIQISGHQTVGSMGVRTMDDLVGETITPQMKIVARFGRVSKYHTPNDLYLAGYEYFKWASENPIEKEEMIKGGMMAGQVGRVDVPRPWSITALRTFIGLSPKEYKKFKEDPAFEQFQPVLDFFEDCCKTQKLDHAMVGIYNANIVSRDLGMADKTESKIEETKTVILGMRIIED